MKINISLDRLAAVLGADLVSTTNQVIDSVAFDTRKLVSPQQTVFFALQGEFRDGHDFIADALEKGIRVFVVRKDFALKTPADAVFFRVENPLQALQILATYHRSQYAYPVVGITGSVGKTIVKEWIYHLLAPDLKVVRSPKSYNSQLGVALSLLEMDSSHQVALIEAGISAPREMEVLERMIQPSIGVFVAFGKAHAENFSTQAEHMHEKLTLFKGVSKTFVQADIAVPLHEFQSIHGQFVDVSDVRSYLKTCPFQDRASLQNVSLAISVALELGIAPHAILERVATLPRLALRMETFDGIHGNLIINDSYNLDLDALRQSLEYQLSVANGRKRVAIIAADGLVERQLVEMHQTLDAFKLDRVFFADDQHPIPFETINNSVVLIKGTRVSQLQKLAALFQLKKHKTRVEVDFGAVKHNLAYYRSLVPVGTKLLVMVKASSYGSGAEKMAQFLQKSGVDYLGVAYADEGVELRKSGITLPILVMNAEEDGFDDIIQYALEPALFSYATMDSFVKRLIDHGRENYPVHLKFDTGMRRLGFEPTEVEKVVELFKAQPEIRLKGVYSHLADADNLLDNSYSLTQISLFEDVVNVLENAFPYSFLKHILNTEGIYRFPQAAFDMIRLGIGVYGYSVDQSVVAHLRPAIAWKSVVSQIKTIEVGESVGYSRRFVADRPMKIAVIPVGYADGFRRSLGMGKGGVVIRQVFCQTVGSVCMDMVMVDVTHVATFEGDAVEIIGEIQTLTKFAQQMETIPYEVLTSISKRVQRIYLEE